MRYDFGQARGLTDQGYLRGRDAEMTQLQQQEAQETPPAVVLADLVAAFDLAISRLPPQGVVRARLLRVRWVLAQQAGLPRVELREVPESRGPLAGS